MNGLFIVQNKLIHHVKAKLIFIGKKQNLKTQKRGKNTKIHFYTFYELTSVSLKTIQVEPHQSILLIQGPIPENIETWQSWKMTFRFVFRFFAFGCWFFQKEYFHFFSMKITMTFK
jgi:hypothetical protein